MVWGKQLPAFNTTAYDNSPSLTIDPSNNVIVSYTTSGTTSSNTLTANQDIVVFKLDNAGNLLWVKQNATFNGHPAGGSPNLNSNSSVVCDSVGNICVCYQAHATLITDGISNSSTMIAMFKLDTDGNTLWAKQDTTKI